MHKVQWGSDCTDPVLLQFELTSNDCKWVCISFDKAAHEGCCRTVTLSEPCTASTLSLNRCNTAAPLCCCSERPQPCSCQNSARLLAVHLPAAGHMDIYAFAADPYCSIPPQMSMQTSVDSGLQQTCCSSQHADRPSQDPT